MIGDTRQYQTIAGPLVPLDTGTGWLRQQPPPPTRRAGLLTALAVAACVLPPLDATALEIGNRYQWKPVHPATCPTRPRIVGGADLGVSPPPGALLAVQTSVNEWRARYPDRVAPAPRLHASVGTAVAPPHVSALAVATDLQWRGVWPDRTPAAPRSLAALLGRSVDAANWTLPTDLIARSWAPSYPDRVPGPRRSAAALSLAGSLAGNPIPDPPPVTGGSGPSAGSVPILQYQGFVGPFIDSPTVVPDFRGTSVYPAHIAPRAGLASALQQSWACDDFTHIPAPPTVTALSWSSTFPALLARRPLRQPDAFVGDPTWNTPPTPVFLHAWLPRIVQQVRPKAQIVACLTSQPHFAVVIQVPVMSWTGVYLDPPVWRVRRPLETGLTRPPAVPDLTDPTPTLAWTVRFPDRLAPRVRSVASLTAQTVWPSYIPDTTVTAPTLSWQGRYPERVPPKVGLRTASQQAWWSDTQWVAPTPPTVPDLAAAVYPDVVPGRPCTVQQRGGAPPVPDVTIPAPDFSWQGISPDWISQRPTVTNRGGTFENPRQKKKFRRKVMKRTGGRGKMET